MAVPTGYTQSAALLKVRRLSNEPNLPVDADVIGFMNDGLEQICAELVPLRNVENVAILAAAATLQLPADIYAYERLTWSTALPTTPGAIEYPVQELGPGGFVEQTGGMPGLSGGQIIWCRVLTDDSGQITLQFYPLSPGNGFINVYHRARPRLWDPNTPTSTTNVDSSVQLLALYWATIAVCENRENYVKGKYWRDVLSGPDGESGLLGKAKRELAFRQRPKGSVVRDVTAGPDFAPPWMPRS